MPSAQLARSNLGRPVIFVRSWVILGRSWGFSGDLVGPWDDLWESRGDLGTSWNHLGRFLGCLGKLLGGSWRYSEVFIDCFCLPNIIYRDIADFPYNPLNVSIKTNYTSNQMPNILTVMGELRAGYKTMLVVFDVESESEVEHARFLHPNPKNS